DVRLGQRLGDRPRHAGPVPGAVERRAEADDLAVDAGAALQRVLPLLQQEHRAALAENESVAVPIKRATRLFRSVAALRQRVILVLAQDAHRVEARVGPAGQEDVGPAALDDAVRLA